MRRPGIEPGSAPWQGAILPLDHRRLCEAAYAFPHSWLGVAGYRSPYLSHAKRALYHLSYDPFVSHPKIVLYICTFFNFGGEIFRAQI